MQGMDKADSDVELYTIRRISSDGTATLTVIQFILSFVELSLNKNTKKDNGQLPQLKCNVSMIELFGYFEVVWVTIVWSIVLRCRGWHWTCCLMPIGRGTVHFVIYDTVKQHLKTFSICFIYIFDRFFLYLHILQEIECWIQQANTNSRSACQQFWR